MRFVACTIWMIHCRRKVAGTVAWLAGARVELRQKTADGASWHLLGSIVQESHQSPRALLQTISWLVDVVEGGRMLTLADIAWLLIPYTLPYTHTHANTLTSQLPTLHSRREDNGSQSE